MNQAKNTIVALLGVVVVGAIAYAVYGSVLHTTALLRKAPRAPTTPAACTMDALQCGDGSWVGRSGPNCQFVCPIPVATTTSADMVTVELAVNQTVRTIQETITVLSILEDSRCPIDVQCIQAGTVRLRIKVDSAMGISISEVALGKSITTESEEITFVTVRPEKESQKTTVTAEYRFVFQSTKK